MDLEGNYLVDLTKNYKNLLEAKQAYVEKQKKSVGL